jgi:tetratricopeptide (TPR) repeat protein
MDTRRKRLVLVMSLPVWLALLTLSGCQLTDWKKARDYRKAFQAAAPQPDWWDKVRVDFVAIDDYDELLDYWQADVRTDNQFFKAAYRAILDHPLDEDLVVNAINLLPNADTKYPYTMSMLEFAIERHFDYQRPLNNYLGKPGDTVAGIARTLTRAYNGIGDYESTIELVERLVDRREAEINDQLLELLTLQYAEALYEYGRTDEAVAALETAVDSYHGDWEKRLRERLSQYRGHQ